MNICVLGAGAIGSWLAAKLALGGEQVTVVARGDALTAIASDGIELDEGKHGTHRVRVARIVQDLDDVHDCDLIVLALKAHQVTSVADRLQRQVARGRTILSLQNGLPWWCEPSVDPGGALNTAMPPGSVIGGVLYVAAASTVPGSAQVAGKGRLVIGEPDGEQSERVQALATVLQRAGIAADPVTDIRRQVWLKLWRNAAFNPVTCLTRTTLGQTAADPVMASVLIAMLAEVARVASSVGVEIDESADELLSITRRFGGHKTSMLQDLERGRPLELDAMVGAVIELARRAGIDVPHLQTIYACARLADQAARQQSLPTVQST